MSPLLAFGTFYAIRIARHLTNRTIIRIISHIKFSRELYRTLFLRFGIAHNNHTSWILTETVFSSHSRWFEILLTYTPDINPTSIMIFTISTVKLSIPKYPFTRITRNSIVFLHVNFCEFLNIPVYSFM